MNQKDYYEYKLSFEIDSADLFEELKKPDNNVVIADVRSTYAYDNEHIPGAISLPHRELTESTAKNLDKTKLYVTYCDGIGCNGSTKGALKLSKLGFKCKELIGGLDWWKRDGYKTEGTEPNIGREIACGC